MLPHTELTHKDARELFLAIGHHELSIAETTFLLGAFSVRELSLAELSGFVDATMELADVVDLSPYQPIDLTGTGGDGKGSINVSTLAAFVVAGAGVPVAKHGNYSNSGRGSSDILEALGVKFTRDEAELRHQLESAGICFLHAPLFHSAFRHLASTRRELRIPTLFNILGPLVHPGRVMTQLIGVHEPAIARLYAEYLERAGRNFAVVHSLDRYDEISLTDSFRLIKHGRDVMFSPLDLGLSPVDPSEIRAPSEKALALRQFMQIMTGEGTRAEEDVVCANAAVALSLMKLESSLTECLELSRESLRAGRALSSLKKFLGAR